MKNNLTTLLILFLTTTNSFNIQASNTNGEESAITPTSLTIQARPESRLTDPQGAFLLTPFQGAQLRRVIQGQPLFPTTLNRTVAFHGDLPESLDGDRIRNFMAALAVIEHFEQAQRANLSDQQ